MEKKRAVVIGATGQIGRAAVKVLARDGWEVTAVSRSGGRDADWPEEVRVVRADRENDAELSAVIGEQCEVVVDVVAYGATHARQLTAMSDRIGSAIVLSTTMVYEDDRGRSFGTSTLAEDLPDFPMPIFESQRTIAPDQPSYGGGKSALEQEFLAAGDRLPTTLLRAGAVYGDHTSFPYELYFVKRNVDGRQRRILEYGGKGLFHRVSVRNLAELIRLAAARPGSRVLNACDPAVPTIAEIGTEIDSIMGVRSPDTILLDGAPPSPSVGKTPWMSVRPMICDMSAAERELGYRPVDTQSESLKEAVAYIVEQLKEQDWTQAFPLLAQTHPNLFDYAAEEAWIADQA